MVHPAIVGTSAPGIPPACDWPLVISSDPSRPVRQQRALYEALLQLERSGASVVERPLTLIDAVLSPSVALMVYDSTAENVVGIIWLPYFILSPNAC